MTEIVVWDFTVPAATAGPGQTAEAWFAVKMKGAFGRGEDLAYHCKARFAHEPPHGWRLLGFQLFNPFRDEEVQVPY